MSLHWIGKKNFSLHLSLLFVFAHVHVCAYSRMCVCACTHECTVHGTQKRVLDLMELYSRQMEPSEVHVGNWTLVPFKSSIALNHWVISHPYLQLFLRSLLLDKQSQKRNIRPIFHLWVSSLYVYDLPHRSVLEFQGLFSTLNMLVCYSCAKVLISRMAGLTFIQHFCLRIWWKPQS